MEKEKTRLSYVELEKEVNRLTKLLKRCEKKYNKQMVVYDRNMENLGKKMIDFETSLLHEQVSIQNIIKEKEKEISSKNDTIKLLQSQVESLQSTQCKCQVSSRQSSFENSDVENAGDAVITLPPLNLPAKVSLQNIGFTNHRPFRPKSKLSPVAEESEVTFSSTLRHVHADTNPEEFHALLTSRLLGSGIDEMSRKNVTPVESFDSLEKLNAALNENDVFDKSKQHESSISCEGDQKIEQFSSDLTNCIISQALVPTEFNCNDSTDSNIGISHDECKKKEGTVDTKTFVSLYEDFSDDIVNVAFTKASSDINNLVKSMLSEQTENIVESKHENRHDVVKNNDDDTLPYDKVSVDLVRNILSEVEVELNTREDELCDKPHVTLSSTTNDKAMECTDSATLCEASKVEELVNNVAEKKKEPTSSSASLDEANDKVKVNSEVSKQKKKKTKKKKKKKANTSNSGMTAQANASNDKVTAQVNTSDYDVTVQANTSNIETTVQTNMSKSEAVLQTDTSTTESNPSTQTNVTNGTSESTHYVGKKSEEDKFSLLVDESLNNLDDLSDVDDMCIETNGPADVTVDKLVESNSFEDLTSLINKTVSEKDLSNDITPSSLKNVDVSEYEVLS